MIEKWIRKIVPDYRSKRELREALIRYEKANVCRIEVKARICNHDLYEWRNNRIEDEIVKDMILRMMPRLKRHLHIACRESIKDNSTYFTAHIDVTDNWDGDVTYEQGYSYRQPDARS
ncbi:MAG: hypothetical protein ACI4MP_07225 [Candidatus Ventricola sp.]